MVLSSSERHSDHMQTETACHIEETVRSPLGSSLSAAPGADES